MQAATTGSDAAPKNRRTREWPIPAVLGLTVALLSGCSTPGPLHLYSIASGADMVHDLALDRNDTAHDVPSYLTADDRLTGFAYDPFTDHFFLRLAPGNHIRVVDRPARKIKREFVVREVPTGGGGDIAVSPRSGHIFFADATAPAIFVSSRLGEFIGDIALENRTTPAAALAFDMTNEQLIVLGSDGRTIDRYTLSGAHVASVELSQRVNRSLAYDSTRDELYAPLATGGGIGVFDAKGQLERTLAITAGDEFLDVGPHSFLRVF